MYTDCILYTHSQLLEILWNHMQPNLYFTLVIPGAHLYSGFFLALFYISLVMALSTVAANLPGSSKASASQ
jgi:hypothetical protein